jgi:hypothetical protein
MKTPRLSIGFFVVVAACFCIGPIWAVDLPDGPGKQIIEEKCSSCHDAGRIAGQKKTKSDWQDTVGRMMDKGAGLSSDDYDKLVDYLAKNFSKPE